MSGLAKQSHRLPIQGRSPEQFEFAFAPVPRAGTYRQTEFPWRYRRDRRRPNFDAFVRLRHLLGQGTGK